MFVQRYFYHASVSEIAVALSLKESTVTVSLMRTRNKLRNYLKKEGFV